MTKDKQEAGSTNYQDQPHNEGQQQNIPPHGQARSNNNSHSMSDMLKDSPEQKAGRENNTQEGNRTKQSHEENNA